MQFDFPDKKRITTSNGNDLEWSDTLGFGYLKSNGYDYGESYWKNYLAIGSGGGIGEALTLYRADFVASSQPDFSKHCDVGIGSGQFVAHTKCKGFDINPLAKQWLEENNCFGDPYSEAFESLSLWDVLEHINNPDDLLLRSNHIFTSMPIHKDMESCLKSKHLKPDEHIWHFTHRGILNFMGVYGFEMIKCGDGETKAGRESIMSYYFKRR